MPHVKRGDLSFSCKTSPLKMFHEFIVGSRPVLMEQILRKKIHVIWRLLFFLCFSYKYGVEYNPPITTDNPTKKTRNPNIIIDNPPKLSDWVSEWNCWSVHSVSLSHTPFSLQVTVLLILYEKAVYVAIKKSERFAG